MDKEKFLRLADDLGWTGCAATLADEIRKRSNVGVDSPVGPHAGE